MNKNSLLALGLLAALPFAASATDGLSYNYVDGGYVNTDAKGGDADGWKVKGSVAVHPNFHIFGDYSAQETDTFKNDVDQWRIGAYYNYGIAPNTDLVARVAYQKFDMKHGLDFNGYSTEVGVRTAFNPYVEGYVMVEATRTTPRSTASTRTASSTAASAPPPSSTRTGA